AAAEAWQGEVRVDAEAVRVAGVRDQILQRAARHAAGADGTARLETQPALSRLRGLKPEQKVVMRAAELAADPGAELSEVGRQAYAQLEDAARRQPGLIGKLRDRLRSYQEPAS